MGDEDESASQLPLQGQQFELHLGPQLRVERGHRLIEQKYLGLVDDRACKRYALLLAARHLPDPARSEIGETHRLQCLCDTSFDLGFRQLRAALLQPVSHVLRHGHMRKKGIALEHHVDRAPMGGGSASFDPVDQYAAIAWRFESSQHSQRRRLAASRWTQKGQEFTAPDFQVQPACGKYGSVTLGRIDKFRNGVTATTGRSLGSIYHIFAFPWRTGQI